MASKQRPIRFRSSSSNWIDDNGEEDKEKRKLKEENFNLRKKLESMALDKAALIQASSRYRTERNDFQCKMRKEKFKIFSALRKEQSIIINEHQKERKSMMERLSLQNCELVSIRAQLSETMDMLNDFLINPVIRSTPNQYGNNEHQLQDTNMSDTTSKLSSPVAGPSLKSKAYESPLKNCSSIAKCARIIAKKRPKRGRKFQGFREKSRSRQPKNFECEKCPLHFFCLAHLKRHIRVDHREPKALQNVVTGCRLCGRLFKEREDHGMHVIMIHM